MSITRSLLPHTRVDLDRPSVETILEILAQDPRTTVVEGLRWRGDHRTDLFTMEERIRDGRVKGIKLYVKFLQGLNLPDAQKEAITWKTAARLFKIAVDALSDHRADLEVAESKPAPRKISE